MFIEFGDTYINTQLVRYVESEKGYGGTWEICMYFSKTHFIKEVYNNMDYESFEERWESLVNMLTSPPTVYTRKPYDSSGQC